MRVLLAPTETAGVATATRDALRRRGHVASLEVFQDHPFGWTADRVIGFGATRRLRAGLAAPRRFDVLHFQFGTTLFAFFDAAWARVWGQPLVLMHYWGSDCRTRGVAEQLFPARARPSAGYSPKLDRQILRRLKIAGRVCRAALVSDLELAAYVSPHFRAVYVLPTPIAPELPTGEAEPLPGEGPIVFHAPSNAAVKGTSEILAALEALGREIPLRVRTLTGVSRATVLAEIARADIVVDQLNSETSGVFALEAMALGKPVLCEHRRRWLAPFARETPLVPVTAETLEDRLRELCEDPVRRERLGREGAAFVRRVHDADLVAGFLEQVYADAREPRSGVFEVTPDGMRKLRCPTL